MPILGVDLSVYQGRRGASFKVFDAFTRNGVKFGIFRASLASSYQDPSFAYNRDKALRKGWVAGAYHFLYHGNAAQQAHNFVDAVLKAAGKTGFKDLIAVVDVEWASSHASSPRYADVVEFIKTFRQLVPGHPIGIYTAEGYWKSGAIGNRDGENLADFLWQARWIDGDPLTDVTLPARPPRAGFGGWATTPLWQWGALHALGNTYDGNAFYGTLDELKALAGTTRPPIPERPNYRLGYNTALDAAIKDLADTPAPAGPAGPAFPAGVIEATKDIADAIQALRLKE